MQGCGCGRWVLKRFTQGHLAVAHPEVAATVLTVRPVGWPLTAIGILCDRLLPKPATTGPAARETAATVRRGSTQSRLWIMSPPLDAAAIGPEKPRRFLGRQSGTRSGMTFSTDRQRPGFVGGWQSPPAAADDLIASPVPTPPRLRNRRISGSFRRPQARPTALRPRPGGAGQASRASDCPAPSPSPPRAPCGLRQDCHWRPRSPPGGAIAAESA